MGFHFGLYDAIGLLVGVAILVGLFLLIRKLFSKS
jgi:hypothetical protein